MIRLTEAACSSSVLVQWAGCSPPPFYRHHHLSDWPQCSLELHCCKGFTSFPVNLLLQKRGDSSFETALGRLKCSACGNPAPVYLCAGHREFCGGATADWAIELVPKRSWKAGVSK